MAKKIKKPKFVVGLGASAGGLDALEQFLADAPTDSGAAFVVVMHLSRDFKSMLDELLARHTEMPVRPAIDGAVLEANTIYVIQPKTFIEVGLEKLSVQVRPDVDPTGAATAVDVMFKSIAKNWGMRGAAIVLSGSGSDGAMGVRALREAGGFTGAQSPETAKFDPMPIAAIATEAVNAVESPSVLASTVIEGLLMPLVSPASTVEPEGEDPMAKIVNAVIGSTSIKASEYKHSTFERRVSRRMMARRINNLNEYADLVLEDPIEARTLSQELLIGVTEFFRDAQPYKVLATEIIPDIIKKAHAAERPIRIWVAGCATGEEVYSIAILFQEALRELPFEIDVQIFGTDISRKHLDEATRGAYSADRVGNVPEALLNRYFSRDEDDTLWRVKKRVRQMVVFAPHDLLTDPPFTKLDLITCRNVLIYFSVDAQQRVLGGFAFGLHQGGYMFLGSSETVGAQRDVFEFVDARRRIFRRTGILAVASKIRQVRSLPEAPIIAPPRKMPRMRGTELQPAYAALLEEFAPSSLLISTDRDLLHTFGDASNYMRAPVGIASLDAAELVDPALKVPLIAAIERVSKDGNPLTFSKVKLELEANEGKLVDLTVRRLDPHEKDAEPFLLAIVDERSGQPAEEGGDIQQIEAGELIEGRNSELELELNRTREALQSTIEENETASEELQASNEELMSANEELQSTNEELSSVNEELYSVNAEYHRQNEELNRLNNDFDLLLNATHIGVLFLDAQGAITRFTGLARRLFNLEDRDLGRPIGNFKSPFADLEMDDILASHEHGGEVVEHETEDANGKPWLIRLVSDDQNFGVVLTFIDIGELRAAELELRSANRMLSSMRKATGAFILETSGGFDEIINQVGYAEFVGLDKIELPQAFSFEHFHPDDISRLEEHVEETKDHTESEIILRMRSASLGEFRYVKFRRMVQPNGNWEVVGIDVDDFYRAELESRHQRAVLEALLLTGKSYRAFVDTDGVIGFANEEFCELIGKTQRDVVGRRLSKVMSKRFYEQCREYVDLALAGEASDAMLETTYKGLLTHLSASFHTVSDGNGVLGYVFDAVNISELREFSELYSETDRMITWAVRKSSQPFTLADQETGRVLFANTTAQEIMGLREGEFEADRFSVSRLTPEFGESQWLEVLKDLGRGGDRTLDDMVLLDEAKSVKQADIMLEQNAEIEDRRLVSVRVVENEHKQKLIRDLRVRSRKLVSSNRDLEQFTTAVAHDLRAPLRHITSFSDLLGNDLENLSPEEIRKHCEVIAGSAKNLSDMVAGLLEYARMGLKEPDMGECELVEVIENVKRNLTSEIEESKAKISINGEGQIIGNMDLLVSLFQNLASNSIKYATKKKAPKIAFDIKSGPSGVEVAVSDNGIGIDPEFKEKIFHLFRRLHSDSDYPGLGIGLTSCRKIADIHKYDLRLDGDYKDGSRFVFRPHADGEI